MRAELDQAWGLFSDLADPEARGRALFAVIPCFPWTERRPYYRQVFALALEIAEDRERARYLIDTFGGALFDPFMERVGRGSLDIVTGLSDPFAAGLLRATFAPPTHRMTHDLVGQAAALSDEGDRAALLEALPHHALGRRGFAAYLDAADSLTDPNARARTVLPVARYAEGQSVTRVELIADSASDDLLRNDVRSELEAFVDGQDRSGSRRSRQARNEAIADPEVRALSQIRTLTLDMPDDEGAAAARLILAAARRIRNVDAQIGALNAYVHSLPGCAPWCPDLALAIVREIEPDPLRARGLAVIAPIADHRQVLAEADGLADPWSRAEVLYAYLHADPPDGGSTRLWHRRLQAAARDVDRPAAQARFLTLLAGRMGAGRFAREVAAEALASTEGIPDTWARAQAVDRLAGMGAVTKNRLDDELDRAGRIEAVGRRCRARVRLARHLGAKCRAQVVSEAFEMVPELRPESQIPTLLSQIVADGELEAWRTEGDPDYG